MSSLELIYIEPTRPYSQHELSHLRSKLYLSFHLGSHKAYHAKCDHSYAVKKNGRKDKEIFKTTNSDSGNCSVCWKFYKTPRYLKTHARNMLSEFYTIFKKEPEYLSHYHIFLETIFYSWLYNDFRDIV